MDYRRREVKRKNALYLEGSLSIADFSLIT